MYEYLSEQLLQSATKFLLENKALTRVCAKTLEEKNLNKILVKQTLKLKNAILVGMRVGGVFITPLLG